MADYSWIKRPVDTIKQTIDMTGYVRTLVAQGYAEDTLVFRFRSDVGLTVSCSVTAKGTFSFVISGGVLGRVYNVAAEVYAPSGDSRVESASVRIREAENTIGGNVVVPPSATNVLALEGGDLSLEDEVLTLP